MSHVLQKGRGVGNQPVHSDCATATIVAFLPNVLDDVVFVVSHVMWHTRWLGVSALLSLIYYSIDVVLFGNLVIASNDPILTSGTVV